MDPIFYLIAGTGLLLFAIVLLWITGTKPKFIPDFPIQLAPRRWTKKQLYEIAKEHNIDGRSKMSRDRLLRVTTGLRPRTRPLKEEKPEIKPKKAFKLSGSELLDYKKEGFRVAGKMGRELRDIRRLSPDTTFTGKFDPNTMTFIVERGEKIKPPAEAKRIEEKEKIRVRREQRLEERKPKVKKPSKRLLEKEVRLKKQQEYDEFLKKLPIWEKKQYPVQQYTYERNLTKLGDGRLARYQKKIVTQEVVGLITTQPGVEVKKIETGKAKKTINKKGYQVVITTLEKPAPDPFKRKKVRLPSVNMSQATSDERINALVEGSFPIKGATREERKQAKEMRDMAKLYGTYGSSSLDASLERQDQQVFTGRLWRKKRPGIDKLTPKEKELMREKGLTPIQAKRVMERAELETSGAGGRDGADLLDVSALTIQDYEEIGEGYKESRKRQSEHEAGLDFMFGFRAPKKRFFPSINPNITFRVSKNKQKACYPIKKPKKTKRKRSN